MALGLLPPAHLAACGCTQIGQIRIGSAVLVPKQDRRHNRRVSARLSTAFRIVGRLKTVQCPSDRPYVYASAPSGRMSAHAATRGVRTTTDYWGTSAAWRVRRMGSSLAGGALGCSARLRADRVRCAVCGGRTSFRRAELFVASGGAEHGPASRAIQPTVSRGGLRGRWPVPAGYRRG
jgi:hypothetical protein